MELYDLGMGRAPRAVIGNVVYHVLNRANGRERIFKQEKDYEAFEKVLAEATKKQPMRILAYCLMLIPAFLFCQMCVSRSRILVRKMSCSASCYINRPHTTPNA